MQVPTSQPRARAAFTLIELLVVITIITLLVALSAAAIFRVFRVTTDTQTHTEVSQLAEAVGNFKVKYGVYPPSQIILCENYNDYAPLQASPATAQLANDSIAFLKTIFNSRIADPANAWATGGINWNGDNPTTPGRRVWTLQGQKCLVFFLGVIPNLPSSQALGVLGFSTNTLNPAASGGDRVNPFYPDFKSNRLVRDPADNFFTYQDPYGKNVYAYFSSYKVRNGYNRYANGGPVPDCQSLGVFPYFDGTNFQNADTFQIISAGRDGNFGPSGGGIPNATPPPAAFFWTPKTANTFYSSGQPGADDIANFYELALGVQSN
jgi:prepilin-type N-terminal cleavage/methylation domain-containing protein